MIRAARQGGPRGTDRRPGRGMATGIEARLKELGITLPEAPAPLANYVPSVVSDRLVFIAGQLPLADGHLSCVGALGAEVGVEEGRAAARQCGLNISGLSPRGR